MAENTVLIQTDLDNSKIKKSIDQIEGSFGKLAGAATAALGAYFSYQSVKKVIHAAVEQENAINRLNQSMRNAGTFSAAASHSMQAYAEKIQQTTTLQDDTVMSSLALARNFAHSNEEAKKLTTAAIELSAATGKDLNTSVQALGKSLNGSAMFLKQAGINTKAFTEEQLKAGAAIDYVASRFQGTAASKLLTFDGAITSLGNNFNSLMASIGSMVTKSPALAGAINYITETVIKLNKSFTKFAEGKDPLKPFLDTLIAFGSIFTTFVLKPFDTAAYLAALLGAQLGVLSVAFEKLASGNFKQAFEILNTPIKVEDLIDTNTAPAMETFLTGLRESINKTKTSFADLSNSTKETFVEISEITKQITEIVKSASIQLISQTAQAVGLVLTGNMNAMKALGGVMKSIIGDMLIKTGEAIVMQSAAFQAFQTAIMSFAPASGIGVGLLLIAAGAALKGAASSVSGGGVGGGGATASVGSPSDSLGNQDDLEKQKQTNIVVNVEGNILDRRQTGLELASAIQEAFDTQGIVFSSGAVA